MCTEWNNFLQTLDERKWDKLDKFSSLSVSIPPPILIISPMVCHKWGVWYKSNHSDSTNEFSKIHSLVYFVFFRMNDFIGTFHQDLLFGIQEINHTREDFETNPILCS